MKRILSTHLYGEYADWAERVDTVDRLASSRLGLLRALVGSAGHYDALILNGSVGTSERYVDLVAAMIVSRRRRPPAIVLTDCSWTLPEGGIDRMTNRVGIRLLSAPRTRFCVRSTAELELFPRTWGVSPAQVILTRYAHRLGEAELAGPVASGQGIFAGGNSLRDYETLLEAVAGLDAPVTIASSVLSRAEGWLPPGNVRLMPIGSNADFLAEMNKAQIVVTPLAAGIERAAGLDTYLAAMALGKLVVVSESPGARDYIDDRSTGLVVPPGDSAALGHALRWALDPAHEEDVARLGVRAAEVMRTEFSYDRYVSRLLDVAEEAAAG